MLLFYIYFLFFQYYNICTGKIKTLKTGVLIYFFNFTALFLLLFTHVQLKMKIKNTK